MGSPAELEPLDVPVTPLEDSALPVPDSDPPVIPLEVDVASVDDVDEPWLSKPQAQASVAAASTTGGIAK